MKKNVIILLAILFLGFSSSKIYAQDYKSTAGIDVGLSALGGVLKAIMKSDTIPNGVSYKTIPVLQFTYEYMVAKKISVGVAASHQYYKAQDDNTSDYAKITRSNFAIRGLFHYGNSDKLDMYSGIRLGLTKWGVDYKITLDETDPTVEQFQREAEDYINGTYVFAPQLVAFGMRYYFTDNIGAHGEFSIGSPYFISAGVNFRF